MPGIIINPGTEPVAGATEENAAANMEAFAADLRERGMEVTAIERHPSNDRGSGRFGFELVFADGTGTEIDMPGLSLDQVRFLGGNSRSFPRLYVDGSSWLWLYALNVLEKSEPPDDEECE